MFDDDAYSLREAVHELGPGVVASAMHPRVLGNALRTADIVVAASTARPVAIGADAVEDMKRGVLCFDISRSETPAFPSLPQVDLAMASPSDSDPSAPLRMCYINAGNAVARTAAMALSNTLLTMLADIVTCDGASNALKLKPGLRAAAYTFLGKPVNERMARLLGVRAVDINIFLQLS
jgi:alanine dehydrogenase